MWSTENDGGRPYVRLYRTVGMSRETTITLVLRSAIPATSHRCISPRKVPVVEMFLQGPNPTYRYLGLGNAISRLDHVRGPCKITHEDRTKTEAINKRKRHAMRAGAYTVRQLHDEAHKRPPRTVDIGKEHVMGHKELCEQSASSNPAKTGTHARA